MLIVFLLGLHLLLISLYGVLIEQRVSKLQCEHLLWALCLPFVGELCLLVAEAGKFHNVRIYKSPLIVEKPKHTPEGQSAIEYNGIQTITREFLMDAIKKKPSNLVQVLKLALHSDDVEVAHIAAANIMRIQRSYEAEIKLAEQTYRSMSDDMCLLKNYMKAIDDYMHSGLLEGDLLIQMMETKCSLLEEYTVRMPEDAEACISLQELRMQLANK